MFDPTIYENLKVVFEGAVYDLDLAGKIVVTNRSDLIDLANMSRSFAIRCRLKDGQVAAELRLSAELVDLAGEKLEWKHAQPGCKLELFFSMRLHNPEWACPQIGKLLNDIWGGRPSVSQMLSFLYGADESGCRNDITLSFDRKIGEGQIDDISELMYYTVQSLEMLETYHSEE
jgi:hypothetical protein